MIPDALAAMEEALMAAGNYIRFVRDGFPTGSPDATLEKIDAALSLAEGAGRERGKEVALLRDVLAWSDGWCPQHRCCAASGLPIFERIAEHLKGCGPATLVRDGGAGAGPKWSSERPTKPGWYWWRTESATEGRWYTSVEFVFERDGRLFFHRDDPDDGHPPVETVPGEWCGPIPEPLPPPGSGEGKEKRRG